MPTGMVTAIPLGMITAAVGRGIPDEPHVAGLPQSPVAVAITAAFAVCVVETSANIDTRSTTAKVIAFILVGIRNLAFDAARCWENCFCVGFIVGDSAPPRFRC